MLAFLDIAPANPGHTLLIPKKHYATLLDANDALLVKLIRTTKKIAKAVMRATRADGFNIGINNKKAAGQLIPHLHVHIIPRFTGDGLGTWRTGKYKKGEEVKIVNKIRKLL